MPNPYRLEWSTKMLEIPRHTPLSKSGDRIFTWFPFLYPLVLLAAITGTWLFAYLELGAVPKPIINDPSRSVISNRSTQLRSQSPFWWARSWLDCFHNSSSSAAASNVV